MRMPGFARLNRSFAKAGLVALLLAGCEDPPPAPIDVRAIGKVQAEIKRQVAMYLKAADNQPVYALINGVKTDIRGKKDLFWCGSGNVDYDVSSIQAELTTSLNLKAGFSTTITPPIPIAASATLSASQTSNNSQTLVFNMWPLDLEMQNPAFRALPSPSDREIDAAPIAQVLLDLRQAQISGATIVDYTNQTNRQAQPCFSNYDPSKPASDAGNRFTIGLTITTTVGGEVSIGIAPVKVGGSIGSTTAAGHSLRVTFAQRHLWILQMLRDSVDADCKYPNKLSDTCKVSTAAYNRLRTSGEIDDEMLAGLLNGPPGIVTGGGSDSRSPPVETLSREEKLKILRNQHGNAVKE